MNKFSLFALALLVACAHEQIVEQDVPETFSFEASISQPSENDTKTVLGEKDGTRYPNYWAAGDAISVNGVTSDALEARSEYVGTSKAVFTITGVISAPYYCAYPAAFVSNYSDGSARITLPATQNMSSDTYDASAFVMVGSGSSGSLTFNPMMAAIKLTVPGTYDAKISSMMFESLGSEKVSGPFDTDFSSLTAASGATSRVVVYAPGDGVSFGNSMYVLIPAQTYASGMRFTVRATDGTQMTFSTNSSFTAVAAKVYTLTSNAYSPAPDTIPDGMMVMSSNVRFASARDKDSNPDTGDRDWTNRKSAYYAMVNYYRPAVIGLQEAEKEQVRDIKNNCSGYNHYGLGRKNGKDILADDSYWGLVPGSQDGEESSTILYRTDLITLNSSGTIWHSNSPTTANSKFSEMEDGVPQTSTWAIMTYKPTNTQFFLLNTHPSIYSAAHSKEINLIRSTITSKNTGNLPVILTGDWNMEEDDSAMTPIDNEYWSARWNAQKTDYFETFHWWGTKTEQIDHIYFKPLRTCYMFRTDKRKWNDKYVSDHYPIFAVFDMSNSAPSVPVAKFNLPADARIDQTLTFTDRSVSAAGIAYWEWDIDGIRSNEQNPQVVIQGIKDNAPVRLTVTDNNGATATATKLLNVESTVEHQLTAEWSRVYDSSTDATAYWSSPAVNAAGDRIYVSSSGYHLVAYNASGTQQGSFDIGQYGAAISGSKNCQTCTPSIDVEGNVYIPVQYSTNSGGNGGLFCIRPNMTQKWYVATGENSTYRTHIPAIFGSYVSVITRNVDGSLFDSNMVILNRSDGSLFQTLGCDKGSYGGMAVSADGKLVFGSARGGATSGTTAGSETSGGFKVGILGGNGTWSTSANSDAGRAKNFLGMTHTDGYGYLTKGFQPVISTVDGSVYVCATTDNDNMIVARYSLSSYDPSSAPTPIWMVEVEAAANNFGLGCVLDDDGNAYVRAADKIFKLNAADGSLAWSRDTGTGNCGVPAIDNLGYVYVTDSGKRRILKLSPQDGSLVSQYLFENSQPRTSPTIDYNGNIYVTCTSINDGGGAILYKLTCPRTSGPGANWSQLGGNPMKTCLVPGATEPYSSTGSTRDDYTPVNIF
ncbi:MAG: PQQ-binding-like beta-propeller repeat protein [Bacteroidales bacterium]|nr:PQQ-binding-like beta-propeller repeat protein [Bacteroidales bacterium]